MNFWPLCKFKPSFSLYLSLSLSLTLFFFLPFLLYNYIFLSISQPLSLCLSLSPPLPLPLYWPLSFVIFLLTFLSFLCFYFHSLKDNTRFPIKVRVNFTVVIIMFAQPKRGINLLIVAPAILLVRPNFAHFPNCLTFITIKQILPNTPNLGE